MIVPFGLIKHLVLIINNTLKRGLWKDKDAIVIYTIGGSEWFHKFKGHLGYKVIKYPLNLVGIYNIKRFYIDNLNKSNAQSISNKVEKS